MRNFRAGAAIIILKITYTVLVRQCASTAFLPVGENAVKTRF